MTAYMQAIGGVMIAVILCAVLSRQGKDFSLLLSCAVCCMLLFAAAAYLEPVIELIEKLADASQLDPQLLQTVMKAVGVGLIGELAALVCADSANAALGKTVEIMTAAAILWLCVPVLSRLLELMEKIVGNL